jgi:phosphonatase-like hydrolase
MAMPRLVVVDFAGTTMKEDGAVVSAYRQAFRAFDIPATDADIAARRGASKKAVFAELATRAGKFADPAAVARDALASFEAALNRAYAEEPVQEIDGAAATVSAFRAAGAKVALTSGFTGKLVRMLLNRLEWSELFVLVVTGDDVAAGRPAPDAILRAMTELQVEDPVAVAVVGDTPLDLQAGTNAGAGWVIGVLSGAHGMETLSATAHTHIIASVADLPALFSR